jgi:ferrochelatase
MTPYQALIVVSFGGPEGPDDVMPFLENVLRGKNVPRERMEEVAEHYQHFGGISPINEQNRELIAALQQAFARHQIDLPIYFGNRNWHPTIDEALEQMKSDGIEKALAFFTSAFSCYSGCRQYRENIEAARERLGAGAPEIHKLRMFFNHPLFVEACVERVREQLCQIPESRRSETRLVFTAHSIPMSMAEGCSYENQLLEASRLVAESVGTLPWDLVYQSRSGPPSQPWLEPDVVDFLRQLPDKGCQDAIVMPIGFLSDHMEVMFDLDIEASQACEEIGLNMRRAHSVGTHPRFVEMIVDLIVERMDNGEKSVIGRLPASHDVCPAGCCLPGTRPARPQSTAR